MDSIISLVSCVVLMSAYYRGRAMPSSVCDEKIKTDCFISFSEKISKVKQPCANRHAVAGACAATLAPAESPRIAREKLAASGLTPMSLA